MTSRKEIRLVSCGVVLAVISCLATDWPAAAQDYLSPTALVAEPQGRRLYIAEATAKQVDVFDTETAKVTATISIPAEPTGLALTTDGAFLYVTCAEPQGSISVIETDTNRIIRRIRAGYGARAPVLSPDGKMLYVCNRFDNSVSVIDTRTNEHTTRTSVPREPFAADITPDGKWLYIANLLPDGPADANHVASKVSVIDTQTMGVDRPISLPNGSTDVHGVAASPDGKYVYVSHVLGRYTVPTTQLERGWMNTNALSIIDATGRKLINTVLLDDVDSGAANPWSVCCTPDGSHVCVTHAGTHELSVIDVAAMLGKISSYEADNKSAQYQTPGADQAQGYDPASSVSQIPNELSFLYGIRQRIKLRGNGARALAIIGQKAYVAEYFTDSLTVVDIGKESRFRTSLIALGPKTRMTEKRRGEMLFNDAILCFQGWQSCASCHPSGARADALNWDLLNDGIGNPKNTKSLLFSHETPPAMITGVRENAELAVRAGITHIQFAVRPEDEAAAIDEYLKSLKPVPSPYLVKGKLSKSARRGQEVFDKAGCASCHSGPLHTDLQKYDVGAGKGLDEGRHFDTPTLIEVWRTAPYLYDGRATTIEEMLTTYNPDDKHGHTSSLTTRQIKDLVRFVLSQ